MRYVLTVLIVFCGKFLESSLTSSRGYVSEKELECFSQEKIYHKPTDKCYRLLTTGPCRRGHWFVLEKPKEALRGTVNVTIKAKCAREICTEGQFYWRKTNSCVSAKDKKKLCGDVIGEELRTNIFGEGECMCKRHPPWARFNGDRKKRCYPLYTQGPCPPAQVFGYLKKLERATCMPDPCYAETLYKRRNKIIAKDAILAPWENGKCYELDTRGPCPEFFTFKVHLSLMRPKCVPFMNSLFQIEKPQNCFPDEEGRCQKQIKPSKNETAVNYRKELFKRFIGSRRRRAT